MVVLALTSPAQARDVFVNNVSGDDAHSGLWPEFGPRGGPVRTVARALALVTRGGRITLAPTERPYREAICLNGVEHRGSPGRPLVIDGGGAILDGTVRAAPGAWHHHRDEVFAMRPRRLAYQQLFHDGRPLKHVKLASWSPAVPHLEPMEWTLLAGRIYLRVEPDRLPADYSLRHAGLQTGVSLYNTEHVRIERLIVQGFQQDGINVHDTVRHCQIIDVQCRANGRSGISIGGASRVQISEASCYDNGRAQLRVEGYANVDLRQCDLDEESGGGLDVRGGRVTIDGAAYLP